MQAIADIQSYLGAPSPRSIDWGHIETNEKIEFPADYRWLCENYGPLQFGSYWGIMHPSYLDLGNRRRRLEETGYSVHDVRRYLAWSRRDPRRDPKSVAASIPYRCYPDVPGLLRWGNNDEVSGLMWLTDVDPAKWTIVISDLDHWWNFDGGVVEFILGMLSGTIECPLIPGGWVGLSIEEDVTPTKRATWELRR